MQDDYWSFVFYLPMRDTHTFPINNLLAAYDVLKKYGVPVVGEHWLSSRDVIEPVTDRVVTAYIYCLKVFFDSQTKAKACLDEIKTKQSHKADHLRQVSPDEYEQARQNSEAML